ncbi:MAG: hypothetical protein RLZZ511_2210 [Cyanobacteriota bacterium]|jgi:5-methylcytosine-specific restriction endonuclease McrA
MNQSNFPLDELIAKLFKATQKTDRLLPHLAKERQRIEAYYSPRRKFERWRDSLQGQNWKEQQYERQNQSCAACQCPIELKGSHIDHIQPLSKYPELAVDIKNLRICCPTCNTSKQANVI